jgi:hypothetical protein
LARAAAEPTAAAAPPPSPPPGRAAASSRRASSSAAAAAAAATTTAAAPAPTASERAEAAAAAALALTGIDVERVAVVVPQHEQQQHAPPPQHAPPLPPPTTATATTDDDDQELLLHGELLDCACWRDVMDVVEDEAAGMSARNLVLALSKLARAAGRGSSSSSSGSGGGAAAAADDDDSDAAATPAAASAVSPADRAALLASPALSALLARLEDALPAMTAFQAANALYSLAMLGAKLEARPGLAAAADAAVARLAPAANERDVASTLYAAAVSRRAPPDGALVPLLRRAQALVARGEMAPRGVAMALWSCAVLQGLIEGAGGGSGGGGTAAAAAAQRRRAGRRPRPEAAAEAAAEEQAGGEEERQQQQQGEQPPAAAAAAAAAPAPLSFDGPPTAAAFAAAAGPFCGVAGALLAKPEAFAELAPQGVANACWALARLQGSAPAALLEQACERLARGCGAGAGEGGGGGGEWQRPQEVLNTLWACVRSRHHPRAALPAVVAFCGRRAASLAAADVGSLFHALGTFAHAPEGDALRALLRRADELLGAMGPVEAASLYWGLGLVKAGGAEEEGGERGAGKKKKRAAAAAAGGERGGGAEEEEEPPPPPPPPPAAPPQQQQQQQQQTLFARLTTEHLPRLWREGRLSQRGLQRQAFTGYLCHRLAGGRLSLPREMLAELKQAWAEGLGGGGGAGAAAAAAAAAAADGAAAAEDGAPPAAPPRARLSPLARDLHRRLRSLRVAHDAGARTPDGLASVDAALRGGGGALAALVLAAEGDFCANLAPRKLLGPALFRRELLERNGFSRVRVVPASEYAAVPVSARPAYVAELLRGLGVGVRPDALERAAGEAAEEGAAALAAGGAAARRARGSGRAAGAAAARQQQQQQQLQQQVVEEEEDGRAPAAAKRGSRSGEGRVAMSWAGGVEAAAAAAVAEASAAAAAAAEEDEAAGGDGGADGPPPDASKPRSARRAAAALGAPPAGARRAARVTDAVATTAEINMIVDALVGASSSSGGGGKGGGGAKRGGGGGGPRRR